ncbi:MAG: hypothetical protein ABI693_19510 [Bryobacteraceae bacterium]
MRPSAGRALFALPLLLTVAPLPAEVLVNGRPSVRLENPTTTLVIDLGGGSIVDFHLAAGGLNPLRWLGPGDDSQTNRPMAHFLCLDRWGQPSDAELRNGMPFHGEAARVAWKELSASANEAAMSALLPMAGLEIKRTVRLSPTGAVFAVSETVTNRNPLGRIYNMVQHATIGPPFLDETTVVDSNAQQGLMQSSPLPDPEKPAIRWPQALNEGQPVDLRHLTTNPDPNVTSFVFDGEDGWVTATNAARELVIGYLFKTADYPWLNIWRHVQDNHPFARGLEFGTTGLHQPFEILTKKPFLFGKPTFTYLDAGASVTRSYRAFLLKVPTDFAGVQSIAVKDGAIVVRERGAKARELIVRD